MSIIAAGIVCLFRVGRWDNCVLIRKNEQNPVPDHSPGLPLVVRKIVEARNLLLAKRMADKSQLFPERRTEDI